MSKQIKQSFVHNQITLQDKIDIIEECRKTLYDYRRRIFGNNFVTGLSTAEKILFNKRKRLEAKLKK